MEDVDDVRVVGYTRGLRRGFENLMGDLSLSLNWFPVVVLGNGSEEMNDRYTTIIRIVYCARKRVNKSTVKSVIEISSVVAEVDFVRTSRRRFWFLRTPSRTDVDVWLYFWNDPLAVEVHFFASFVSGLSTKQFEQVVPRSIDGEGLSFFWSCD